MIRTCVIVVATATGIVVMAVAKQTYDQAWIHFLGVDSPLVLGRLEGRLGS